MPLLSSPGRRALIMALIASFLAACVPAGKVVAAPGSPPLQERLQAYSRLVEAGRWVDALAYFDEEHRRFQEKIYFDPDYNEHPPDPTDLEERKRFVTRYLLEAMGVREDRLFVEGLIAVRGISFTGLEEPFGSDGPYRVTLELQTATDPVQGWVFVDRASLAFSGSSG